MIFIAGFLLFVIALLWAFGIIKINRKTGVVDGMEGSQALTLFELKSPDRIHLWHKTLTVAVTTFLMAYGAMIMGTFQEVGSLPFIFWIVMMVGMIGVTIVMTIATIVTFFDQQSRNY